MTASSIAPLLPSSQAPAGRWHELTQVVLAAVILALFVRTFLVQAFVVPSGSMEPTVLVGDHVMVNKFLFAPHLAWLFSPLPYRAVRRGDVVVFKFPQDPEHDFIKRIAAVPGDILEIRDGVVFVNGSPEARSLERRRSASGPAPSSSEEFGPTTLGSKSYFAMGDNRDNSYDSRFWGPVPAANLKGRALTVYWSLASAPAHSWNPLRIIATLARATRWSRTFRAVR